MEPLQGFTAVSKTSTFGLGVSRRPTKLHRRRAVDHAFFPELETQPKSTDIGRRISCVSPEPSDACPETAGLGEVRER